MAARYLAVVPKSASARSKLLSQIGSARPRLHTVFSGEGSAPIICVNADCPDLVLPSNRGLVLGHLFSKSSNAPFGSTAPALPDAALQETPGEVLMSRAWGGYVAFFMQGETLQVIRDPSGALPCFYAATDEAVCFASDIDMLFLAGVRHAIDWDQLTRHLVAFDLREPETALYGITELMPGDRVTLANNRITRQAVWSPWSYAAPTSKDGHALEKALASTVGTTVRAWADRFQHVLLNVSGGLDSSITAAALTGCTPVVTCLTMATDEAEGDERQYARIVTDALGLELIEAHHRFEHVDIRRTGSAHLPRPVLFALGQSEAVQKLDLIQGRHIDACFTGIGGDNVFCNMQSASPIIDRLRYSGLRGLLDTFMDVCDLTEASLFEVGRAAVSRGLKPNPTYRWHTDTRFLNPERVRDMPPPKHPWLEAPANALPGKAAHIAMLVRIQATIDSRDRAVWPPQVHPLLSQPIVELCLGIPTWEWVAGGVNRSVARRAFSEVLSAPIIRRRSKGSPNSFAHRLVSQNREVLRDHLLGGRLNAQKIIDTDSLSKALSGDIPISGEIHLRLLMLAEAEAWARHHAS